MRIRALAISIIATLSLLTNAGHGLAQEIDQGKLHALKAAFLYNTMKFTTWPEESFEDAKSPIVVGMVGEDPVCKVFIEATAGRTIQGRPIEVRHIPSPVPPPAKTSHDAPAMRKYLQAVTELHAASRACHVLHVTETAAGHWAGLRKALGQRSILTISDTPGFARRGGMVEMYLDTTRSRLQLLANVDAATHTQLRISSQFLRVATIVHPPEDEEALPANSTQASVEEDEP